MPHGLWKGPAVKMTLGSDLPELDTCASAPGINEDDADGKSWKGSVGANMDSRLSARLSLSSFSFLVFAKTAATLSLRSASFSPWVRDDNSSISIVCAGGADLVPGKIVTFLHGGATFNEPKTTCGGGSDLPELDGLVLLCSVLPEPVS